MFRVPPPRVLLQALAAAAALAGLPAGAGVGEAYAAAALPPDPAAYDLARSRLGDGALVVYTAPGCRYCAQARRWLRERALPFAECDVQRSAACAGELAAHGGRGVPYFVMQGQEMAGFSPNALERLVQAAR